MHFFLRAWTAKNGGVEVTLRPDTIRASRARHAAFALKRAAETRYAESAVARSIGFSIIPCS